MRTFLIRHSYFTGVNSFASPQFSKGTRFDEVTQEGLNEYVSDMKNQSRKLFGWLTPAEVFHERSSKGRPPDVLHFGLDRGASPVPC